MQNLICLVTFPSCSNGATLVEIIGIMGTIDIFNPTFATL
jgi:hypothetical protein